VSDYFAGSLEELSRISENSAAKEKEIYPAGVEDD
jgi:hypothetical protein